MLARWRRRAEEQERDQALHDAESRAARLESAAEETAAFLLCAGQALSAGVPATRVSEALTLWAALNRPDALARRRAIAVAGPLAELIEAFRQLAGDEREILYIEDGGGNWLHARIDRSLFLATIRELLDNVLRHAGSWSRITVTAEPAGGEVVVKVRDDGDTRDCVPGLGLRLARRVAELHGGGMSVSFERGAGLTATTRWPSAQKGNSEGDLP